MNFQLLCLFMCGPKPKTMSNGLIHGPVISHHHQSNSTSPPLVRAHMRLNVTREARPHLVGEPHQYLAAARATQPCEGDEAMPHLPPPQSMPTSRTHVASRSALVHGVAKVKEKK